MKRGRRIKPVLSKTQQLQPQRRKSLTRQAENELEAWVPDVTKLDRLPGESM